MEVDIKLIYTINADLTQSDVYKENRLLLSRGRFFNEIMIKYNRLTICLTTLYATCIISMFRVLWVHFFPYINIFCSEKKDINAQSSFKDLKIIEYFEISLSNA